MLLPTPAALFLTFLYSMKPKRSSDSDLWMVGLGFGLTIMLLLGSAFAAMRSAGQRNHVVYLLLIALVLSVICGIKTVQRTKRVLLRARWQARELSRLSGHVLEAQDSVARKLSRELHEEFGHTLRLLEANLAAIPDSLPHQQSRIDECRLLVKEAMAKVGALSQALRPVAGETSFERIGQHAQDSSRVSG